MSLIQKKTLELNKSMEKYRSQNLQNFKTLSL